MSRRHLPALAILAGLALLAPAQDPTRKPTKVDAEEERPARPRKSIKVDDDEPAPQRPRPTFSEPGALTASPRPSLPDAAPLAVGAEVRTTVGERRRLALAGSTVLFVNEQTHVQRSGERELTLSAGEVYADVPPADDGDREALTVKAGTRTVSGRGAKFAVRREDAGPRVVVAQGQVRVSGVGPALSAAQFLDAGRDRPTAGASLPRLLDWTRDLASAPLVPVSRHSGGSLSVHGEGGEERLSLRKYHIDAHVEDGFARTMIDQTYFNSANWRLEGTFRFPLPPDASLSRLAMYVDGRLMEGGMTERDFGRQVYEKIVGSQRDPALLEWGDGTTFRMRVFPLEPRQEKRIVLCYTQRLPLADARLRYQFPAGHSLGAVDQWSFHARVKDGKAVGWRCPSHPLKAREEGADLLLDAEAKRVKPDRDLLLEVADPSPAAARFSRFEQDGAGYLMLRYRPDLPPRERRPPRQWVFVVEMSGDRNSPLARTQIEVVRGLLAHAEADDSFVVLAANTRADAFPAEAVPLTPALVADSLAFLETRRLIGGLDLSQAFDAADRFTGGTKETYLVHVGGGNAILGERRPEALLKRLPAGARYVGVAIGKRGNHALMRSAAEKTSGLFMRIDPNEPVSWRAFELSCALNAPRLLDVKVTGDRGTEFLPLTTAVSQGEEVCAVARFDPKAPPDSVALTATLDGKPFRRDIPVKDAARGAGYLPRTWAKLQIDRLLAGGGEKHKGEIVDLSKAMYVMTPYTSLLVLESEKMYAEFKVDRGRKDHWALYPCPERIAVVTEPLPGRDVPRAAGDKPDIEEVLSSIFVRVPKPFLEGTGPGRRDWPSPTAWDYFAGTEHGGVDPGQADIQEQIADPASELLGPPDNGMGGGGGGGGEPEPLPGEVAFEEGADDAPSFRGLYEDPGFAGMFGGFERLVEMHARYGGGLFRRFGWANGGRYTRFWEPPDPDPDFRSLPGGSLSERRFGPSPFQTTRPAGADALFAHMLGAHGERLASIDRRANGRRQEIVLPVELLYHRPAPSGDQWRHDRQQVLQDLLAHAPGLNTTRADILAALEAEAAPTGGPLAHVFAPPGRIDDAARLLIDRARSAGWQEVTVPTEDGRPAFAVICDGTGRFSCDRVSPEGLRERIVCDGKTLLHVYPEIAVGAHRAVSRFHRAEFAALVPWAVPLVEDLARGADVKAVEERTVAVMRPDGTPTTHLVFATDGRLVERCRLSPSGKVFERESYAADGTVARFDAAGKEVASVRLAVRPGRAPEVKPDLKTFVVLPLPFRTRQHVTSAFRLKADGLPYEKLSRNAALALVASCFGKNDFREAEKIISARFRGDDRSPGLGAILASMAYKEEWHEVSRNVHGTAEPLAHYLEALAEIEAHRKGHETDGWVGEIGGPPEGFLQRLAAFHDLRERWRSGSGWTAEGECEVKRALDFVRQRKASILGWALLAYVSDHVAKDERELHARIAECWPLFAEVPGLAYAARYEQARFLVLAGKRAEARKLFEALHADTLARGIVPPIDDGFRDAFRDEKDAEKATPPAWAEFVRCTASALLAKGRRVDAIGLAWQCWVLGDESLAGRVAGDAVAGLSEAERVPVSLAGLEFFCGTGQFSRAESLLQPLLSNEADPGWWRLASAVADRQGKLKKAVGLLDRALELERRRATRTNLASLRWSHTVLMLGHAQVAESLAALATEPPADFAEAVGRAADRWRSLDPDGRLPSQAAAHVLRIAGAESAAWDYLTTPLALRPEASVTWVRLARELGAAGDHRFAERAFAEACAADPDDAEALWERARNLRRAGREEDARRMLRRLIEGTWPERFRWVQDEARRELRPGSER